MNKCIVKLLLLLSVTCLGATTATIKKVKWVSSDRVDMSLLEPAGKERPASGDNNMTLYVVRGSHSTGIIPGKYNNVLGNAYISYDGKAIGLWTYEFLVSPPGSLSWIPGSGRNVVPDNFIYGGAHPITMERLYVCRGLDSKYLILGWYSYNEGICSISYGTSEFKVKRFEVLVLNAYGQAINAGKADSEVTWQI